MSQPSLPVLLQQFFVHLRATQDLSPHTIAAYRDSLKLLLHFMAKEQCRSLDRITWEAFSPPTILAFLEHLQQERRNSARTRNARLAALRTFVRFCLEELAPDFLDPAQRILAIPCKRTEKPLLGFLSRPEVEAILAATEPTTWTGQRDQLLFGFLYNTGARISEALQVTPTDLQNRAVRLRGKGRKQREVPLWTQTYRQLQQWCRDNQIGTSHPIFGNGQGQALSRRQAARRLALTLPKAALACPSLRNRTITLHTWRHTCAMHLLQAGVALEIIALWLGHEQPTTTHGYLEADLNMKKETLSHLHAPNSSRHISPKAPSNILAFLEAL